MRAVRGPLAVLALLALAASLACGGEPPAPAATTAPTFTATATVAPVPMPMATPTATPTPTATVAPAPMPTPLPCQGVECIEPAPDLFERRVFEPGERIDWPGGSFVLDSETGRIEGYRLADLAAGADLYGLDRHWDGGRGRWLTLLYDFGSHRGEDRWSALLDRETGAAWQWPSRYLRLVAMSRERLLFEDRSAAVPTGRFTLLDRDMESIARFTVGEGEDHPDALFSPEGLNIALELSNTVYLVPVDSASPVFLFRPQPHDVLGEPSGAFIARNRSWGSFSYVKIVTWYADNKRTEQHFSWSGDPLPDPSASTCAGTISPDGRYVAVPIGDPVYVKYVTAPLPPNPWSSVLIVETATCEPILRVRSVRLYERAWSAAWLSTSDGFVVGVNDGYMVARIHPHPELVRLPIAGGSGPWDIGPEPAPTGGGCYFGHGPNVYDACEDRWFDYGGSGLDGPAGWGATHRERWFVPSSYWGEGWVEWLLLPPKLELPPFDDEIAFRVTGTGSCLSLREEPDREAPVRDCQPDGARLRFVKLEEALSYRGGLYGDPVWVYVRAGSGLEGWVSREYLEWW